MKKVVKKGNQKRRKKDEENGVEKFSPDLSWLWGLAWQGSEGGTPEDQRLGRVFQLRLLLKL